MEQVENLKKDPETTEEIKDIDGEGLDGETETCLAQEIDIEPEVTIEEEEVASEDTSAKAYLDRLQRTLAEFDNYRKRTEKEKSAMYDMGLINTVLAILPVLDNFERALDAPCADSSYVKGMEMIYKQMMDLLDSIDVTQIDAKGQQFDANLHNAVLHVEDDQYGENEVIEDLQKGYIYKDKKIIRHSMVQVAN